MPELPNGAPCYGVVRVNRTVGSNPTLSAMVNRMRRVLLCAVLAASGVVAVAQPAHAAQCVATYVVKAGDSWWRIAEKNNTNLRAVLSLNNAKKSTKLLAGKTVCVPGAAPVSAPQQSMSRAKVIQIIRDSWPD